MFRFLFKIDDTRPWWHSVLASLNLKNYDVALRDIRDGFFCLHIWPMLGWMEIKQRYKRSVLGPFWITISTGCWIVGVGLIWGKLFNSDTATYLPYLGTSFILWQFVSSLINDACEAFIAAEGYIKQTDLPLSIHVFRMIWRTLIMFAHNLVLIVALMFVFPMTIDWHLLLFPLGLLVLLINSLWIGLLFGLLCARFRDIPLLVASVVQLFFFITPIMWNVDMLGKENRWVADLNPFFHFLELVRAPILGYSPSVSNWIAVIGITAIGYLFTLLFYNRFKARIAYWV